MQVTTTLCWMSLRAATGGRRGPHLIRISATFGGYSVLTLTVNVWQFSNTFKAVSPTSSISQPKPWFQHEAKQSIMSLTSLTMTNFLRLPGAMTVMKLAWYELYASRYIDFTVFHLSHSLLSLLGTVIISTQRVIQRSSSQEVRNAPSTPSWHEGTVGLYLCDASSCRQPQRSKYLYFINIMSLLTHTISFLIHSSMNWVWGRRTWWRERRLMRWSSVRRNGSGFDYFATS